LEPESCEMTEMLGQIAIAEDRAGRGMLTAVVVRKDSGRPGDGFFELARKLGRDTTDRERFWIEELNRVYAYWSNPGRAG